MTKQAHLQSYPAAEHQRAFTLAKLRPVAELRLVKRLADQALTSVPPQDVNEFRVRVCRALAELMRAARVQRKAVAHD